jgi:hypothetical protein
VASWWKRKGYSCDGLAAILTLSFDLPVPVATITVKARRLTELHGNKLEASKVWHKPLSISSTGTKATYYSHKTGGGDYSSLAFTDYDSPNNPFAQVDTYLRIRADATKNSSGLISSLKADGTGITATLPCYFECRFMSSRSPEPGRHSGS